MENETILATDHINQRSDAGAPSMSLSGQGANIDLDARETEKEILSLEDYINKYTSETYKKKYTQGEYQVQINEANRRIEELNEWLDWLNSSKNPFEIKPFTDVYKARNKREAFANAIGLTLHEWSEIAKQYDDCGTNHWKDVIKDMLAEQYQIKNDILYNSEYDPRDYNERREDTATQRKVEDYTAAGLNKTAVSGFYGGGGGGSGGGSAKEEDDERKKRRKRREAAAAAREAAKQRNIDRALNVLSTIANIGGRHGSSLIIGNAWGKRADAQVDSSKIHAQSRLDVELLRDKLRKGRNTDDEAAWLDDILDEIRRQEEHNF